MKSGGIGFLGFLGLLFIGLKLTHYIDWSWWWVTVPLWGPLGLIVALSLVVALGSGIIWCVIEVYDFFQENID